MRILSFKNSENDPKNIIKQKTKISHIHKLQIPYKYI